MAYLELQVGKHLNVAFPMILRPILQARSACSLPFVDRAEQNMATGIDSFRYRFRYRNFTSLDFRPHKVIIFIKSPFNA